MDQDKHKKANENIYRGIDVILKQNNDATPMVSDLVETLDILLEKMQQSKKHLGVPFYIPVAKGSQSRTSHDFRRDIMGEMKELLLNKLLHQDVDHSITVKYLVSPIMSRLNLFDHEAAITASPIVISNAKSYILQHC